MTVMPDPQTPAALAELIHDLENIAANRLTSQPWVQSRVEDAAAMLRRADAIMAVLRRHGFVPEEEEGT